MTPLCDAGSRNGLCRGERSHGAGGKPASFQNLSGAPDTTANMERPSAAGEQHYSGITIPPAAKAERRYPHRHVVGQRAAAP
jgi:hypothetical protein